MIIDIDSYKTDKTTAVLALSGRLDTVNAPLLERKIKQWENDITEIILDFSELEYISSMGLRVLLQAQKITKEKNQRLVIQNVKDAVREVFQMTGFLNLMVLEEKFVVVRKDEADSIMLSFNGEMDPENIPQVSKELSNIQEQYMHKSVTVILDMENLSYISEKAAKSLSQVITTTAWEGRKLGIQNAPADVKEVLQKEGLRL
jgi:anti-sigma B factor antagonist